MVVEFVCGAVLSLTDNMSSEVVIRLTVFLSVLVCVALLELVSPMRELTVSKKTRWLNNLSLVILNTIVLRLVFPVAAVGVAIFCQNNSLGLLNIFSIPSWVKVILATLVLDFVIYLQHVLFHFLPLLWRFHKVHHVDLDIDVTTGLRFHPVEMILSMLIKIGVIFFIGAPVVAVIIFEVVLNAMALFNHGNIRLPKLIDKVLRMVLVTPDVHRVHHSTIVRETNSNFGFNLILWDKLLGTYQSQPQKGHIDMEIGLDNYRDPNQTQKIWNIIRMPFLKK